MRLINTLHIQTNEFDTVDARKVGGPLFDLIDHIILMIRLHAFRNSWHCKDSSLLVSITFYFEAKYGKFFVHMSSYSTVTAAAAVNKTISICFQNFYVSILQAINFFSSMKIFMFDSAIKLLSKTQAFLIIKAI